MIQMLGYLFAAVGIFAVAVLVVALSNRLPSLTSFQIRAEFKKDTEDSPKEDKPKLGDGNER
jgi:uncharacterized membrane protein YcjF (UPF0283 family)